MQTIKTLSDYFIEMLAHYAGNNEDYEILDFLKDSKLGEFLDAEQVYDIITGNAILGPEMAEFVRIFAPIKIDKKQIKKINVPGPFNEYVINGKVDKIKPITQKEKRRLLQEQYLVKNPAVREIRKKATAKWRAAQKELLGKEGIKEYYKQVAQRRDQEKLRAAKKKQVIKNRLKNNTGEKIANIVEALRQSKSK